MEKTIISHNILSDGSDVTVFVERPLQQVLQDYANSLARARVLGQVYDTTKVVANNV